jgi:hypothetical protein
MAAGVDGMKNIQSLIYQTEVVCPVHQNPMQKKSLYQNP